MSASRPVTREPFVSRSATRARRGLALALTSAACAWSCGGAQQGPPSALLLTLDTTRADALGCYGAAGQPTTASTPHLDRIAAEGVRYARAYTTVPLTLPSHASLLTGLYPPRHGVRLNGSQALAPQADTLAERARAAGVQTAAFVAAVVLDASFGLDQGFETYHGPSADGQRQTAHIGELPARTVVDRGLAWLAEVDTDRPFFLWVHLFDPHGPTQPVLDPRTGERDLRAGYLAEVSDMDHEIGRLLDGLEDLGWLERTWVAVVGDHGESLFEHGEGTHGTLCFDSTLRVPLLLRDPSGRRAGEVSEEVVSVVDLYPTLAAALALGSPADVDGLNLLDPIGSQRGVYFESYNGHHSYGWSPLTGWVDHEGKYLHSSRPSYFELAGDPNEEVDRAAERDAQVQRARRALARIAQAAPLPRPESEGDASLLAGIRALGYAAAGAEVSELPSPDDAFSGRDPSEAIHLERDLLIALAHNEGGRLAEAESLARGVLAEDPKNPFAHDQLATALLNGSRFAEAVPHFEAAEGGPGWSSASFNLGLCLVQLDRIDEALAAFGRAQLLDPGTGDEVRALADFLERTQQKAKADRLRHEFPAP